MRSALFFVLALLAILAVASAAKTPKPKRPLCKTSLPIDGVAGKTFATGTTTVSDFVAVAVEGNIVVGSYGGTVYIYWWDSKADSLSLKQTLNVTDDVLSYTSFGKSLSLENNILVVGQPQWIDVLSPNTQPHGRVFVYQTLSDSAGFVDFFQLGDPIASTDTQDTLVGQSNYGAYVFQRNMTLAIGAPQCCSGNRVGTAYTYTYNTTSLQWETSRPGTFGELPLPTPPGLPVGSAFGTAVTFTGQLLLATAPGLSDANNVNVKNVGGIIYFNFDITNGKTPACGQASCQAKLNTWGSYPTPEDGASCGASMSNLDATSNRVSIGCPGTKNDSGSVLIGSVFPPSFSISNRILNPTATFNEGFGTTIAQQYDSVIIGTATGTKVYVFERVPIPRSADSYVNTQTLTETRTQYGASLDLDGFLVAVGSWGGLDVYNCGNPVSSAISALPFLGLLLLSVALLL